MLKGSLVQSSSVESGEVPLQDTYLQLQEAGSWREDCMGCTDRCRGGRRAAVGGGKGAVWQAMGLSLVELLGDWAQLTHL